MAGNSSKWFWGILVSLVFAGLVFMGICFLVFASVFKSDGGYTSSGSGDKIGVVEINDVIMSSENWVSQIKKFREDKSIKAIIVHINSPGGGVAASQEIYEEVRKTRESGKIIVVSMASIAASGGYYIACGGSLIVSNPGTLTGSIGVIVSITNFKDLADKIGVTQNVIKSADLKDAGNPFREMTEKDRAYFQDVVDNSFGQFLDVVARERKMNMDTLKVYATGRVFTGLQAQKIGLVDSLGTFEDAVRITSKMAGIEGEPRLIREKKRFSLFEKFIGATADDVASLKARFFEEPLLQYKFVP